MTRIKPYTKVVIQKGIYLCAIFEPHPFRSCCISEAMGRTVDTGVSDDEYIWVYYDFAANPIGLGNEIPDGKIVDKFTIEDLDFSWTTPECTQSILDYLNKEP